ncbi:MAG TPA: glycosyltransferase [Solirubrobacteraceae bacterium]
MIVAVDARALAGRPRGVARYARQLTAALAAAFPEDEYRLVVPGRSVADAPAAANVTLVRTALPGRVVHGAAAVGGRPRLARLAGRDAQVAWLPAPSPVAVGDVPWVVTVHDLSWEERPRDFTAYERAWHALARPRALARRAAAVVVDAAPTRAALVERWRLDPASVHVVAPGISASPAPPGSSRFGRYVLYVGALEPRKAPELLLGAFARARARGLRADLVVAGTGRRARALAGRPGVHLLGAVADAELDALYAGALAVVLPSWLEGYGLPPLEALAHGTPAIVADLPVYDGTLGAAALRFAPGDAPALAEALLRVEGERDRLLAAAPALPTWADAARALRAILAEAAAAGAR